MEYAQNLLSWFSDSRAVSEANSTASAQSPTHRLPPPNFLSSVVRRGRRSQTPQTTPTGKEPLTALEEQLRDLVLDRYSDQVSNKPSFLFSESEEQSEIDSGHFSDRPTTSFSEPILPSSSLFPLSTSSSSTMVEPRATTPLTSYNNRISSEVEEKKQQQLPSFSADDIANDDQAPQDNTSSSNFKFGSHLAANPANFPSSTPYGMTSLSHDHQVPPPNFIPLYSYTEPSLEYDSNPKVSSSDLRSLVSKSFQLPTTSHQQQHRSRNNSTQATPTSTHQGLESHDQEAAPPRQDTAVQSKEEGVTEHVSHNKHSEEVTTDIMSYNQTVSVSDTGDTDGERDEFNRSHLESVSQNQASLKNDEVTDQLTGPPSDPSRDGSISQFRGINEDHSLPLQSPLSPKDVRDRLADLARATPPTPLAATPIRPRPVTPSSVTPTRPHPVTPSSSTPTRPHPVTPQDSTPTRPHPATPSISTPTRPHPVTPQDSTPTRPHPVTTSSFTPTGPYTVTPQGSRPNPGIPAVDRTVISEKEEDERSESVKEKEVLELYNYEDTETSSVVSLDQITEALRQEPIQPLTLSLPSAPHEMKTPDDDCGHQAFSLPLSSSPRPSQIVPFTSKYTTKLSETSTSSPLSIPQHLQPTQKSQVKINPDKNAPTPKTTSKTISSNSQSPSAEHRLSEVLHAQAHLQGQLETVSQECKELLQERAALNSKLAVTEAELELARRETKPLAMPQGRGEENTGLKRRLVECERQLEEERQTLTTVREELARLKKNEGKVMAELEDKKEKEKRQEHNLKELNDQLRESKRELEEEKVKKEEAQQQLRSLNTSYGTVEQSKGWMQTQLQEALESKIKLQEELRASKAELITNSVKIEQLVRENETFLQQITTLQRGVLQDKARLVSELEAIEADVLHREDSYTRLVTEKTQLEELVQQRAREIEKLSREVGHARVEMEELKSYEKNKTEREENLVQQITSLQNSRTKVEEKLEVLEAELVMKEEKAVKLEQMRLRLQQRLQESETALVEKDGDFQRIKDSQEIVNQELNMTREAQRKMEGELEEERRQVAVLRAKLGETGERGEEELVKSLQILQEGLESETRSLRERLEQEKTEVREKERELASVYDQRKKDRSIIGDLNRKLDTAHSEQELLKQTVTERERTIQRVSKENREKREEVEKVTSELNDLQTRLNTALLQNSRLEGQLSEQSSHSEIEHLQEAVRERATLKRELELLKQAHRQEMVQTQGRVSHLSKELEHLKTEKKNTEEQLTKFAESLEEASRKLTELKNQKNRELEETRSELEKGRKRKEVVEREVERLRSELEETQAQCSWLQREMQEARGRLAHESAQKGEVERASGMVALKLKQNAEETERRLREKNQSLSLELEQMKGRLTGITSTLKTLKTHSSHLEEERAERDSRLTSLRAELEKLEREKQLKEEEAYLKIASARDESTSLHAELAEIRRQLREKEEQINELTQQLASTSHKLSEVQRVQSIEDKSLAEMEDKVASLVRGRDELRLQLSTVNAELVVSKTTAEVTERELQSLRIQYDILQQNLVAMETQWRKAMEEVEESRRREEERESTVITTGGRRALFETTLSSIGGDEEVDIPGTHDSSSSSQSELHTAQLRELGQQIERARRQGQEAAEAKTSGEISVLRDQLGSKSRTINSLQSWLVSLRGDMGKLQSKIQSHSATVRASHHTTRQLENQLADLKKSSSLQSPSFLSSPP